MNLFHKCWQLWQLRTLIHDNHCKSDTGQHSQSLRCFLFVFRATKRTKGKAEVVWPNPFVRFLWKLVIPELIGRVNEAETLTLRQNGLFPETHKKEGNKENNEKEWHVKTNGLDNYKWSSHVSQKMMIMAPFFWYEKESLSFGSYHFKLILSPDNPPKPHEGKTKLAENTAKSFTGRLG